MVAFGLRMWLSRWLGPPYITFFPTVMMVALLAGLGPGLLATALSAAFAIGWILPAERGPGTTAARDVVGLALFTSMGVLMSTVAHLYRRARARLVASEAAHFVDDRVRQSEERLRLITDTIPDPVFLKDTSSRILFANPATLRVLGRSAEEVIGRTDRELYPDPAVGDAIVDTDRAIMASGEARMVEERVQTPDGYRYFLSTKAPYHDASGRVAGLIGVARDITERRDMEEALREADRRKNEFLGVLSHELRNPLAPIRNALYIIDRAPPGSEQAERAKAIAARQLGQLSRLVDDLLDVTRISRGKVTLQRERVDLRELATRATEDHRELLSSRGVRIELDLPGDPVIVDADPARISQVIGNLLQNCAKFTDDGGVVGVSVGRDQQASRLAVRDSGIGMPPELLARAFEPFTQGDETLHRARGGLGLGLALVRGMVELHGGTVMATSAGVGSGTEVIVRLPLAASVAGSLPHPHVPSTAVATRRVLVIEDNLDAAATLRDALQLRGHSVDVAHDGCTGLERARALRPEFVLCDIGLPEMDGYAVARAIRADAALASTVLVALTGYARPEDRERTREAGFQFHLSKPVVFERLDEVLASPGSAPSNAPVA